jgi:uncharacterized protein
VNSVDPPDDEPRIDNVLVVADSSISGKGLFATANIETGRVVIRLGGRLVSTDRLEELLLTSPEYVDTLTVYEDLHLVLPSATEVHFGNHSCDPNLWHVGPYEIAARRPVEAGNEVTIDYGTQSGAPGFSMMCTCGADICRGEVTSDDWKLASLQIAYAGHWVPALEKRIQNLP